MGTQSDTWFAALTRWVGRCPHATDAAVQGAGGGGPQAHRGGGAALLPVRRHTAARGAQDAAARAALHAARAPRALGCGSRGWEVAMPPRIARTCTCIRKCSPFRAVSCAADGSRVEVQLQLERLDADPTTTSTPAAQGGGASGGGGAAAQQNAAATGGRGSGGAHGGGSGGGGNHTRARLLVGSVWNDRLLMQLPLVVETFPSPHKVSSARFSARHSAHHTDSVAHHALTVRLLAPSCAERCRSSPSRWTCRSSSSALPRRPPPPSQAASRRRVRPPRRRRHLARRRSSWWRVCCWTSAWASTRCVGLGPLTRVSGPRGSNLSVTVLLLLFAQGLVLACANTRAATATCGHTR